MGKRFGLTGLFFIIATGLQAAEACQEDAIFLRGDWGQARFAIDVADTAAERSQGLMFVETMPTMSGMLFVYDREQTVAFWMKNTLIPLDMIFANGKGIVRHVHENAIPGDETAIPGGTDIQYVLEINGGMARRLGIDIGTELQHPSIPVNIAAWPCQS